LQVIQNAFTDERFCAFQLVIVQLFIVQMSSRGSFLGRKVTGVWSWLYSFLSIDGLDL